MIWNLAGRAAPYPVALPLCRGAGIRALPGPQFALDAAFPSLRGSGMAISPSPSPCSPSPPSPLSCSHRPVRAPGVGTGHCEYARTHRRPRRQKKSGRCWGKSFLVFVRELGAFPDPDAPIIQTRLSPRRVSLWTAFKWEGNVRTFLALALLCLTAGPITAQEITTQNAGKVEKPIRLALRCSLQSQEVKGMNRVCYYDCAGITVATSILSSFSCTYWIDR
jgi:hypothetical protein